ncbi:MAG: winged helix-turn-helix domain-containing protein [Eubacteriales bacterium]
MTNRNHYFPEKNELKEATLQAIRDFGGVATTQQINSKVAEILKLSEEILSLEDESGLGTMYEYRMRWIRTELKGQIINPKRGTWVLPDNSEE